MQRSFVLSAGLILAASLQIRAIGDGDKEIRLRLNKDESFTYLLESKKSFIYQPEGTDTVLVTWATTSKHRFTVEEVKPGNEYIINYRKLYTISEKNSGGSIDVTDSRFPQFGNTIYELSQCYLNTVEYRILFSPDKNEMTLLNSEEIRNNLVKYIEQRGQNYDKKAILAIAKVSDYKILQEIMYMRFYPDHDVGEHASWTLDRGDDDPETYTYMREEDTTVVLKVEKSYHDYAEDQAVPGTSMQLISQLLVNNASGLLQSAEISTFLISDSLKENTRSLFLKRSDITDYKSSIRLVDYSRWANPTILSGQITNAQTDKLCLVYNRSIVGSLKTYQFIDLDEDGNFMQELNIEEPTRYKLYYLEEYPIHRNQCIQLFIEPGDSIHISALAPEIQKKLAFSGINHQNSKFLNDVYYDRKIGQYLEYLPVAYLLPIESRIPPHWENINDKVPLMIDYLESGSHDLSLFFYEYMKYELLLLSLRVDLRKKWEILVKTKKSEIDFTEITKILPDSISPLLYYYTSMEQYRAYINDYVNYQFSLFNKIFSGEVNKYAGTFGRYTFSKSLLSGYAQYVYTTISFETLLYYGSIRGNWSASVYNDIMMNCNNPDVRDYINERYQVSNEITAGNKMPEMNLINMEMDRWDWKKAKNRVVVLMMYNDYRREQFYCKDLFTEYGENMEDVIILRISPGYNFAKWKEVNSTYSTDPYQMYFSDSDELFFNTYFFTPEIYSARYLIIGRDGRIFSEARSLNDLKRNIKAALAVPVARTKFTRTIWVRILPGILLGMILSFVLYRLILYRRYRKKELIHRMTRLEQKAIRAQLNPHFLFNCLNSIQSLIRSGSNQQADKYLTKFAGLIRQVLTNSEKEEISIAQELTGLEIYLELEKLRFDFDYHIELSDSVDLSNTMIPPMMLHPFVENSILHGFQSDVVSKYLLIQVDSIPGFIRFRIDDNGIGWKTHAKNHKYHNGKGINLIENRIELLNKMTKEKYEMKIFDKQDRSDDSTGTVVEILIPDEQ